MKEMRLADIDQRVAEVVRIACPNLHDLNIKIDEATRYFDVDFYFKDDPRKDEEGYLGQGITEFIPDSPTWNRLTTIMYLLKYCLNLEWEEDDQVSEACH